MPCTPASIAMRVRERVCERYVEAISGFRHGEGYRVPGEFVIVSARR
ncbi:hypothetical protein [Pseudoduganella rhizocola]